MRGPYSDGVRQVTGSPDPQSEDTPDQREVPSLEVTHVFQKLFICVECICLVGVYNGYERQ